jgi:hypothetical protein
MPWETWSQTFIRSRSEQVTPPSRPPTSIIPCRAISDEGLKALERLDRSQGLVSANGLIAGALRTAPSAAN